MFLECFLNSYLLVASKYCIFWFTFILEFVLSFLLVNDSYIHECFHTQFMSTFLLSVKHFSYSFIILNNRTFKWFISWCSSLSKSLLVVLHKENNQYGSFHFLSYAFWDWILFFLKIEVAERPFVRGYSNINLVDFCTLPGVCRYVRASNFPAIESRKNVIIVRRSHNSTGKNVTKKVKQ